MSKNKNARPAGGTAGQAVEKNAERKIHQKDFNTDSAEKREFLISNFLHKGRGNGLTLRDLSRLTGMDGRSIRQKIHEERKRGVLIISDCVNGYFLAENVQEVRAFIHSMDGRAREIAEVSRAAADALAQIE